MIHHSKIYPISSNFRETKIFAFCLKYYRNSRNTLKINRDKEKKIDRDLGSVRTHRYSHGTRVAKGIDLATPSFGFAITRASIDCALTVN